MSRAEEGRDTICTGTELHLQLSKRVVHNETIVNVCCTCDRIWGTLLAAVPRPHAASQRSDPARLEQHPALRSDPPAISQRRAEWLHACTCAQRHSARSTALIDEIYDLDLQSRSRKFKRQQLASACTPPSCPGALQGTEQRRRLVPAEQA